MNQNEKICIITGATSGIGKYTAISLAKKGVHIVIPCRNTEKGALVKEEIIKITGNDHVTVMECNLESIKSIEKFVQEFKSAFNRLDILINNAGTWQTKRKLTDEGIEVTFAVNVLAPFLLSNLLLDLMKSSSDARIINVASQAHKVGKIDFHNLQGEKSFKHIFIYGQSKIALMLVTKKMATMLNGTGITVNSLHPGVVATNLFNNMGGFVKRFSTLFMISPEKGASTTIYLATSDDVANVSGKYFVRRKPAKPLAVANDMEKANVLWEICNKMTSKNF